MKNLLLFVSRVMLFGVLMLALNYLSKLVFLQNLEAGVYTSLTDATGARVLTAAMVCTSVFIVLFVEELLALLGKALTIVRKSNAVNLFAVSVLSILGILAEMMLLSVGADWADLDHIKIAFATFAVSCLIGFMLARQVLTIRQKHIEYKNNRIS